MSRVLEFEGYKVSRASDCESGLKILKEMKVDMVILDLQLPVRDGFSFLKDIKSQPDMATIPILVLSASAEASKREKALELGADKYLVKPISIPDLKENVKAIIGRNT